MPPVLSRRYLKTRAVLLVGLSAYSSVESTSIRFANGARGENWLVAEPAISGLHFSVAQGSNRTIIAAGRSPPGNDIESLRGFRDVDGLAARLSAPGEVQELRCVPRARREQRWLRFRAPNKSDGRALGEGIAMGFRIFGTAFNSSQRSVLQVTDGNRDRRWSIRDLIREPKIFSSVAVCRNSCALWCWRSHA